MKAFFQISVGKYHNRFAEGEAPADNFVYLYEELGSGDKGLPGNLALELGNSGGGPGIMELGLDKWAEVVGSSTVRWHSWERYSDKGVEFGKIGGNMGTWGGILEIWRSTLVRQI